MPLTLILLAALAAGPAQPAKAAPVKPAVAKSIDRPPPMIDGIYIEEHACPGEGCYLKGRMQWMAKTRVYDRPGKAAKPIGWLAAKEWAEGIDSQYHTVPLRGVVTDPRGQKGQLARGDVVYIVSDQGEGAFTLWRSGRMVEWADEDLEPNDAKIAWDPLPKTEPVLWLKVRRDKGPSGWVRDLEQTRCLGYQDRDEDCPKIAD